MRRSGVWSNRVSRVACSNFMMPVRWAMRAGIMPTWGVVALAAALIIPLVFSVAALFLPWYALRTTDLEPLVLVAPFCMLWVVIGGALRRGFPEGVAEVSA